MTGWGNNRDANPACVETVPKHNISPSTRIFPRKERYEIFDGKMLARKSCKNILDFCTRFYNHKHRYNGENESLICTIYSSMHVCMYVWSHIQQEYGSTASGCQSCSWSAEQGNLIFPCPRSCLKIWSRETVSAVSSRVSLLISILRLKSGVYLRDSSRVPRRRLYIYLNRHTPSGQSQVYWVTQLRTDGVHCRESAGTGPVNLKVVPNECCLSRSPWTN